MISNVCLSQSRRLIKKDTRKKGGEEVEEIVLMGKKRSSIWKKADRKIKRVSMISKARLTDVCRPELREGLRMMMVEDELAVTAAVKLFGCAKLWWVLVGITGY